MLNTLLTDLIWGSGRCRISLAKLMLGPTQGGMGVPDLRAYCYAAQLQWLAFWLVGRNLHELNMTPRDRDKGNIYRLLLPRASLAPSTPPLLKLAITYWKAAQKYTSKTTPYAPTIPLLGIPTRLGPITVTTITSWTESGITTLGDFFADGMLLTHDTFTRVHGTPTTLFLLNAHISNYICTTWSNDGSEPPTNALLTMQYLMGNGAHLTRWITHGICTERAISLQPLRDKWECDANRTFTDKEWGRILEYPRKVSRNPKFKFIQSMLLHRAYLTPRRLHTMFPNATDECPRCHTPPAGLVHMLWSCPKLGHYWSTVCGILKTVSPVRHNDTLEYCILGLGPRDKNGSAVARFANLALLLAKRNITSHWKSTRAPSLQDWHTETIRWGKAEGAELVRDEYRGLRKTPISLAWHAMLEKYTAIDVLSY